ncbi:MAG: hypothetical protein E6H08_11960 [Bacteroidetes bacterium]|nr:MAG: hypothetical protein E6H08_11960 [Bacteroidota bacterium]
MKTIIRHPDFAERDFSFDCLPLEIEKLSTELVMNYCNVPSVEIWNTESINAVIAQIEFSKDSGFFNSSQDIKMVYEALSETFSHLKSQAEYGSKFMPDENPEIKKKNFKFFYNRVALGDNTILVRTDKIRTVFFNYIGLNYMSTRDEAFCDACYNDLQNLMKKSTLISDTGEKQRNVFFSILMNKIKDRTKNL